MGELAVTYCRFRDMSDGNWTLCLAQLLLPTCELEFNNGALSNTYKTKAINEKLKLKIRLR